MEPAAAAKEVKKETDCRLSHLNIINILSHQCEIAYQQKGLDREVTTAANFQTNPKEM